MKRQSFVYILLPALLAGILIALQGSTSTAQVNVTVYGKSNTGFSWVRTYTGDQGAERELIEVLQDSYIRLAESMGAGSELKIFAQGKLIAEETYEGEGRAPYSGLQMAVHDRFASRYDFATLDDEPGYLADMESPREPFICESRP